MSERTANRGFLGRLPFPVGPNMRQVRRALHYGKRPLTTADLIGHLYPRLRRLEVWHWKAARQAAERCGLVRVEPRTRPRKWKLPASQLDHFS
jgi:hypothetical protein